MRRLDVLWLIPTCKLLLHLVTFKGYGLFRDEFYYVACSKELAFGYVDHPPLSLLLLAVNRAILGESAFAIRVLPAVTGALTVLVTGLITRRLGGGRFAQSLAMVAVGLNFLYVFHYFSMNCIDILIWALAAYLMVRIVKEGCGWHWIALGILLGLGLENKLSVLWLGAGLVVGLLITRERRWLATCWPWVAGALALVLFVPHLLWQVSNDWPTLEFIRNATSEKMIEVAPVDFGRGQLNMLGPAATLIWLSGLVYLFILPSGRPFRLLGWIYLTVFTILMFSGSSRSGYLSASYTWLLAAGAVAWENWLEARKVRWLRVVAFVGLGVTSILTVPFSLPVLPVEDYIRYAEMAGVEPATEERKELADLPQYYADMFGWDALVAEVADAYESLSPAERDLATIFTSNYGNSGAIDYYGVSRGLPPSISGHNNYWLWGHRGFTGEVVIVVGSSEEALNNHFDSVQRAGTVTCRYCMPYENNKPIWIARGMHQTFDEMWPDLKHYD